MKMNKSKITVIVPIYNVEKYVGKCLQSLIDQTFSEFVVFAVNDGSPDNSCEVVKTFCKKDNRIRLLEKENGGYGSVLEYAIQRVETPYFLICDPDDWLKNTALEELYDFAIKNDLDLVVGDKYNVYVEDNTQHYIKTFSSQMDIKPYYAYEIDKDIQRFSFGYVSPHAKLYRTKICKNIIFPHKVNYTDYLLYVMALSKAQKVAYYPQALAYYLLNRPGNTTTDRKPKIVEAYTTVWNCTMNQLEKGNNNYQDVLYYRMYLQFRFILKEYGRTTDNKFNDKYFKLILNVLKRLQVYKRNIYSINYGSIKDKLLLHGVLNPLIGTWTIKKYINRFNK